MDENPGKRSMMHRARQEADALGHDYLGTEHVLLALTGTVASFALATHGVQQDVLRELIIKRVGMTRPTQSQHKPCTLRVKQAVEQAMAEARAMGQNFVGPEHVLLGLLHVDGGALHAIRSLGASPVSIRRTVLDGLEQDNR